jgi:hypothetical protein
LVVKDDDPEPINKNSIVFINDYTAYVFMIRKFAVTTNGGINWAIWDAGNVQPAHVDPSCRIQTVNIAETGRGNINMKCNKAEVNLFTNDFGVSWQQ